MVKSRIAVAGALGATALLLAACGTSSEPAATAVAASPAPSVSPSQESGSATAAPVEVTTKSEQGAVAVPKGGYFLFPIPPSMLSGAGMDEWKWSVSYNKGAVGASGGASERPKDAEIAMGSAKSGQVWQAKQVAGPTVITYSYINPSEPNVQVKGTYTVTVK